MRIAIRSGASITLLYKPDSVFCSNSTFDIYIFTAINVGISLSLIYTEFHANLYTAKDATARTISLKFPGSRSIFLRGHIFFNYNLNYFGIEIRAFPLCKKVVNTRADINATVWQRTEQATRFVTLIAVFRICTNVSPSLNSTWLNYGDNWLLFLVYNNFLNVAILGVFSVTSGNNT